MPSHKLSKCSQAHVDSLFANPLLNFLTPKPPMPMGALVATFVAFVHDLSWKKTKINLVKKIKILYVEDEPFLGKIVKESLESRDYEVCMISDGSRVIPAFQKDKPDICVLDVMLPNKDGFTLGKEIRALDERMPIIFLTAKNQTQDLLKGFQSGGNDYIKKPFSMEELIVRVQNLLTLRRGNIQEKASKDIIDIGRYQYFPQKYELHLEGSIQKLSYREAQLLNILIAHRNYNVERKEILKKVWGDDSFFNSRNLDVYVKKMRDYLKEDEKVRIITLKGVGYHFLVE